jgi:DNA-binding PadR family transcriptional regulator
MNISQEWIKGTVVPIILKLLAEREMYGYEIIQEVQERTNQALQWKEGTIYPWLHRLEGEGLISSSWSDPAKGRKRKYYKLTRKGEIALRDQVTEWSKFSQAVNVLLLGVSPA